MARPGLDFALERSLLAGGHRLIAGLDEVGRGPLAGPVVAAAVVLDPARIPEGLADSKALSANRRERIAAAILESAHVGIGTASPASIDRLNIRGATLRALCRALAALPCRPDLALVDGRDVPDFPCAARAIVRGDASVASIAAASIVAKVVRDRMMARLGAHLPAFGFERNAGYPTASHRAALRAAGPTSFHRLSFAPCREARDP
nr:ribonuclease HII [Salinarimonas soli]